MSALSINELSELLGVSRHKLVRWRSLFDPETGRRMFYPRVVLVYCAIAEICQYGRPYATHLASADIWKGVFDAFANKEIEELMTYTFVYSWHERELTFDCQIDIGEVDLATHRVWRLESILNKYEEELKLPAQTEYS